MNWLLVIYIIVFGSRTSASTFDYKIEPQSLMHASVLQHHELTKVFTQAGFVALSDISLISAGMPFDSAFVSSRWEKSLLLKAGLIAPKDFEGRIIEEPSKGLLAFHFYYQGTPYLLVATEMTRNEFQEIVKPWLKAERFAVWSMWVPSARADDCASKDSSHQSLKDTANHIQDNALRQSIGRCAMDAFQSVKKNAQDTLDLYKKFATNSTALWSEMKESFNQLINFTLNMNTELQQILSLLPTMSTEQKTQMACMITGQLIAGTLESLLIAGGLVKLLPQLILKLRSATSAFSKIAQLQKMGFRIPNNSFLTQEILSCAM